MSQDVEIKENKTLDEFTKLQDLSRLEGYTTVL